MTAATERQLALLEAIRLGHGVTRADIRSRLPYYDGLSEAAFAKAFERDIAMLRQSGYPIEIDGEYSYHFDVSAPLIAPVDSMDLGLLRTAVSGIGTTGLHAMVAHNGLQKLLASSEADDAPAKYFRAAIPEGAEATTIARALQFHRAVSFEYTSISSAKPHHHVLRPAELSVHFDSFYVYGESQREDEDEWYPRVFKISRIVPGTLSVGETLPAMDDDVASDSPKDRDAFTESVADIAIRPGAARPLAARGVLLDGSFGGPDHTWPVYRFENVNRQRLFDSLLTYGVDVRVIGSPHLVAEWRERLEFLAHLVVGPMDADSPASSGQPHDSTSGGPEGAPC